MPASSDDPTERRPDLPAASAAIDSYKPHVDGLRAISIVAVVAYHAEVSGFSGGFVGVDIFFVISGYLIINQILSGLAAGRFQLFDFYARRALRILPAYGAMLLFTLAGVTVLQRSHGDINNYAVSAMLAPIFLTNVYFLVRSGYFDTGASTKPLLHTWSLAVEEQFYLVVPLLLMGLYWLARRRGWRIPPLIAAAAVIIGLASLIGCIRSTSYTIDPWVTESNPAFFLTWWRAWEFVAGGVIAALAVRLPGGWAGTLIGFLAGIAGLALLGLSIEGTGLAWLGFASGVNGRVNGFPGVAALMPVAGAMLVILSGLVSPRGPVVRVLSLAPILYLGQISYALYLWHWPMLTFGRYLPLYFPSWQVDAVAVALAVLFAILTRHFIELPILAWRRRVRLGSTPRLPRLIFIYAVAGCIAVSAVSGLVTLVLSKTTENAPLLAAIAATHVPPARPCGDDAEGAQAACLAGPPINGILLGDSHAYAMLPRLDAEAAARGVNLLSFAAPGCDPVDIAIHREEMKTNVFCAPLLAKMDRFKAKAGAADFLILDAYWNARFRQPAYNQEEAVSRLKDGLEGLLTEFGADPARRVLVMGPLPSFYRTDPFNCVSLSERLGLSLERCGVPRQIEDDWRATTVSIMKGVVARHPNARFVDPIDLFCDDALCMPTKNGTLAFFDTNHVNEYGAKLVFDRYRDDYLWAFGRTAAAQSP